MPNTKEFRILEERGRTLSIFDDDDISTILSKRSPSGSSSSPERNTYGHWEPEEPEPDPHSVSPRSNPSRKTSSHSQNLAYEHHREDAARIRSDLQLVEQKIAAARKQAEHCEREKRMLIDKLLLPGGAPDKQCAKTLEVDCKRHSTPDSQFLPTQALKNQKNQRTSLRAVARGNDAAATKIQAVFRGSRARKNVKNQKADASSFEQAEARLDRMLALLGADPPTPVPAPPRARAVQKQNHKVPNAPRRDMTPPRVVPVAREQPLPQNEVHGSTLPVQPASGVPLPVATETNVPSAPRRDMTPPRAVPVAREQPLPQSEVHRSTLPVQPASGVPLPVASETKVSNVLSSIPAASEADVTLAPMQEATCVSMYPRSRQFQQQQEDEAAATAKATTGAAPKLKRGVSMYPRVRRFSAECAGGPENEQTPQAKQKVCKKKRVRSVTPPRTQIAKLADAHTQQAPADSQPQQARAVDFDLDAPRPGPNPHPYPQGASESSSTLETRQPPPQRSSRTPPRQTNSARIKAAPERSGSKTKPTESSQARPKEPPPPPWSSSSAWSDSDTDFGKTQPRGRVQQDEATLKQKTEKNMRAEPQKLIGRSHSTGQIVKPDRRGRDHPRSPSLTSLESEDEGALAPAMRVNFVAKSAQPARPSTAPTRRRGTADPPAAEQFAPADVHSNRRAPGNTIATSSSKSSSAAASSANHPAQRLPLQRPASSEDAQVTRAKSSSVLGQRAPRQTISKSSVSKIPSHANVKAAAPNVPPEGQAMKGRGNDGRKDSLSVVKTDGDIYQGQWKNDKRHGHGTSFFDGGVFEGQWVSGKAHGVGRIQFKCGDTFEGQYVANKKCGHGTYTWQDGSVDRGEYVGGFKEGWHHLTRGDEDWEMFYERGEVMVANQKDKPCGPDKSTVRASGDAQCNKRNKGWQNSADEVSTKSDGRKSLKTRTPSKSSTVSAGAAPMAPSRLRLAPSKSPRNSLPKPPRHSAGNAVVGEYGGEML